MSMVSLCRRLALPVADRRRVHELLRLVLRSAAGSPQIWGEQTDVPESADWYNSTYIMVWGSNVPQTRTPDAHFFTEVRYKGTKIVAITPDYAEVVKFGDLWLHPKQGTDAALGDGDGPRDPEGVPHRQPSAYFADYAAQLHRHADAGDAECKHGERCVPDRFLRASDFADKLGAGQQSRLEDRRLRREHRRAGRRPMARSVSAGAERAASGIWSRRTASRRRDEAALSLIDRRDEVLPVGFPYFGGVEHEQFRANDQGTICWCATCRSRRMQLGDGESAWSRPCSTCCWPTTASTAAWAAATSPKRYDDDVAYTPAWQEKITGVKAADIITVAREFADNADKTHGKSMVIIGAAMNHWYHNDMNYRGIINMLMMCGCVGQSGGGWAHYVGQEKLRPQTGWTPLAFALDWHRPPRQHELHLVLLRAHRPVALREAGRGGDPLAAGRPNDYTGSLIDFNVRAERMGWLPSAPQLQTNPLQVCRDAAAAGIDPKDYAVEQLKDGALRMSLRRSGQPGELPAQPVRLALQPARHLGQGPRVLPQAPARYAERRPGRTWARTAAASPRK